LKIPEPQAIEQLKGNPLSATEAFQIGLVDQLDRFVHSAQEHKVHNLTTSSARAT